MWNNICSEKMEACFLDHVEVIGQLLKASVKEEVCEILM